MDRTKGFPSPPFRRKAFSMPELLVLSALLFLTAFVALPAAYPYFMKAHRQAGTIKLWEQNTNALNQQSAPLNE
jgi:hypothetical protein